MDVRKKLLLFGAELDWDKEYEIFFDGKGVNIEVSIKELVRKDYTLPPIVETRHNCTEFHHRFNKKENLYNSDDNDSAFESDIHGTGGTKRVGDINWIKITKANIKHKNY